VENDCLETLTQSVQLFGWIEVVVVRAKSLKVRLQEVVLVKIFVVLFVYFSV
jgi:hypothetical protein